MLFLREPAWFQLHMQREAIRGVEEDSRLTRRFYE